MKKLYLFAFITCFSSFAFSQKNAPVAGEAAQLVDLLKRDYSAIDPALVDDEIVKDRGLVISIFKNYMTEDQKKQLKDITLAASLIDYESELSEYRAAQKALSAYVNPQDPKDLKEADANKKAFMKVSNEVDSTRQSYYLARYSQDAQQLGYLARTYKLKNKYVAHVIEQFIAKYASANKGSLDVSAKSNPNASLQKGIPFLGGDMGFEVVIDGLSKFLAKRIKEELTSQVINKVKEWLENPGKGDPLAELKILLPRTNAYLLGFNASQVTNFPNEIKQYIEDDLNHLIENMADLKDTPRIKQLVEKYPDCEFALEALEIIPTLSKIKDPIDYFEAIENSRNISRWKESDNAVKFNIANALQLSGMLAHSYCIIDNGQTRFAGSDFMGNYGADLNFYLLYTGFLRQQNLKYYNVEFMMATDNDFKLTTVKDPSGASLTNINKKSIKFPLSSGIDKLITKFDANRLNDLNKDRQFFEGLFAQVGEHTEKVYNTALDIKKANKKGSRIGVDTVHAFVESVIGLAEEVSYVGDTLVNYLVKQAGITLYNDIKDVTINYTDTIPVFTVTANTNAKILTFDLKAKAAPYFKVATATNDIVLDLQKKKYATALLKALELTADILPDGLNETTESLSSAIKLAGLQARAIRDDSHAEDWARILGDIVSLKAGQVKEKKRNSASVVYNELQKIKLYYRSSYTVEPTVMANLDIAIKVIQQMEKGSVTATPVELTSAAGLMKEPKFHRLVLSYYTDSNVDELLIALEAKLKDAVVQFKGQTIPLFDNADITAIKDDLQAYEKAAFSYLENNNKEELQKANEALKKSIATYLQRMPDKIVSIPENTRKLIHFVNDMALAQNSDDIEKAIEAFALPAGSYSIKRESRFNATINSFPGILPAWELTWKNNSTYGNFSPAFTVPVGFCLAWGSKRGFSNGIYIPVIDIGAVTRMHLDGSDSTSTLPEFNFLSVFSPGLYYHLGFRKTSLSLNIGAQYGPGLREIKAGEAKIYESLRFGLALVFDIPLLNLATKPWFER